MLWNTDLEKNQYFLRPLQFTTANIVIMFNSNVEDDKINS